MAVLFQFITKEQTVKVAFYKLIDLGANERAIDYLNAIKKATQADDLWEPMKARLSAVVSDGASVIRWCHS